METREREELENKTAKLSVADKEHCIAVALRWALIHHPTADRVSIFGRRQVGIRDVALVAVLLPNWQTLPAASLVNKLFKS